MAKLIAVYLLIPLYLRFRYRKDPRIRSRIDRWFLIATAVILLVIAPWGAYDGTSGMVLMGGRLAAAGLLAILLVVEIRRALREAPPKALAAASRSRRRQ